MPSNDFIDRLSSLDTGYAQGDLSIFPQAIDNKNILFEVKNNAETKLLQTVGYTSRFLTVENPDILSDHGVVKIGEELIYYQTKNGNQLTSLKRGFAGSRQGQWSAGTTVTNAVIAEHHNAVKDAIYNIETDVGTKNDPAPESLNGLLKSLENRFLSPKPIFRASPRSGPPPLTVTFQNFSGNDPIRYLWDFGDGTTSTNTSPTHTYLTEGVFTVKMNMITSLGAQGISVKSDYITVDSSIGPQFFYVTPVIGTTSTTFEFVDQTVGDITNRYWIFDDGEKLQVDDPDNHTATHQYTEVGTYNPTLLIVFKNQNLIRLQLTDPIQVV